MLFKIVYGISSRLGCPHNVKQMGRGGGQVVSLLAFYSDDPSSNPADAYSFSVQIVFEKNENV